MNDLLRPDKMIKAGKSHGRTVVGYVEANNRKCAIYQGLNPIGRHLDATVIINNPNVSQRHAFIIYTDSGKHYLCDYNSSNNTCLDNKPLTPFQLYELHDGARIQFSNVETTYKVLPHGEQLFEGSETQSNITQSFYQHDTQQMFSSTPLNRPSTSINDLPTQLTDITNIHDMPTQLEVSSNVNELKISHKNVPNSNLEAGKPANLHELPTQLYCDEVANNEEVASGEEVAAVEEVASDSVATNEEVAKAADSEDTEKITPEVHEIPTQTIEENNEDDAEISRDYASPKLESSLDFLSMHFDCDPGGFEPSESQNTPPEQPKSQSTPNHEDSSSKTKEEACMSPGWKKMVSDTVNSDSDTDADEDLQQLNITTQEKSPKTEDSDSEDKLHLSQLQKKNRSSVFKDTDSDDEVIDDTVIERSRVLDDSGIKDVSQSNEDKSGFSEETSSFKLGLTQIMDNSSQSKNQNSELEKENISKDLNEQNKSVEDSFLVSTQSITPKGKKSVTFAEKPKEINPDEDFDAPTQKLQVEESIASSSKDISVEDTSIYSVATQKLVFENDTKEEFDKKEDDVNEDTEATQMVDIDQEDIYMQATQRLVFKGKTDEDEEEDEDIIEATQKDDSQEKEDYRRKEFDEDFFLQPTQKLVLQTTAKKDEVQTSRKELDEDIYAQPTQKLFQNTAQEQEETKGIELKSNAISISHSSNDLEEDFFAQPTQKLFPKMPQEAEENKSIETAEGSNSIQPPLSKDLDEDIFAQPTQKLFVRSHKEDDENIEEEDLEPTQKLFQKMPQEAEQNKAVEDMEDPNNIHPSSSKDLDEDIFAQPTQKLFEMSQNEEGEKQQVEEPTKKPQSVESQLEVMFMSQNVAMVENDCSRPTNPLANILSELNSQEDNAKELFEENEPVEVSNKDEENKEKEKGLRNRRGKRNNVVADNENKNKDAEEEMEVSKDTEENKADAEAVEGKGKVSRNRRGKRNNVVKDSKGKKAEEEVLVLKERAVTEVDTEAIEEKGRATKNKKGDRDLIKNNEEIRENALVSKATTSVEKDNDDIVAVEDKGRPSRNKRASRKLTESNDDNPKKSRTSTLIAAKQDLQILAEEPKKDEIKEESTVFGPVRASRRKTEKLLTDEQEVAQNNLVEETDKSEKQSKETVNKPKRTRKRNTSEQSTETDEDVSKMKTVSESAIVGNITTEDSVNESTLRVRKGRKIRSVSELESVIEESIETPRAIRSSRRNQETSSKEEEEAITSQNKSENKRSKLLLKDIAEEVTVFVPKKKGRSIRVASKEKVEEISTATSQKTLKTTAVKTNESSEEINVKADELNQKETTTSKANTTRRKTANNQNKKPEETPDIQIKPRGSKRAMITSTPATPVKKPKANMNESISEQSDTHSERSNLSSIGSTSILGTPERSKRTQKHKVVFTMLDSPQLEVIIRQLGGSIVDSVDACTVLVTGTVKRTSKLLSAVGQGKPICSPGWLHASKKAKTFLDPWEHILKDDEAETKWSFSLEESLRRSASKKLLQDYAVHVIIEGGVKDVVKGAVEACGGKCVTRAPAKNFSGHFLVVGQPENRGKLGKFLKQQPPVLVVAAEAILEGVLRQELRLEEHVIT